MSARSRWAWLDSARCATRPDLAWIADPADVTPNDAEATRAVCAACPVLTACDAAALSWDVTAGWWAGTQREMTPGDSGEPVEAVAVWVPITVGRARRALAGAWQGLLDVGGAA